MHFRITVRYGSPSQRYHTFEVDADDACGAMAVASAQVPEEVGRTADLVEIRAAVDPENRPYAAEG